MNCFARIGRIGAAAFVFAATCTGQAYAANTVNGATVNGSSSATVLPGAALTVAVTNTTSSGTQWGSTQWYIGTSAPGTWNCDTAPETTITSNGTNTVTLTGPITAPAVQGTYNLYVRTASNATTCSSNRSSTYTLSGAVSVAQAPVVQNPYADGVGVSGATLHASVTSNNSYTNVSYEYGFDTSYGKWIDYALNPLAPGALNAGVSAVVSGLQCNALYHFRANAANGVGIYTGADATFTTSACIPPTVTTGAATPVSASSVTLNGTVSSNGSFTNVNFEYGPDATYGKSVTYAANPLDLGATNAAVAVSVANLTCGQPYHYRVIAANSAGVTFGNDATFTLPCVPTVTTLDATAVTSSSATLNGKITSNGAATAVTFEYGTSPAYGSSAPALPISVPANGVNAAVSAAISSLNCGTLYHFRVNGVNSAGTSNGNDLSFTTASCPVQLGKTATASSAMVNNYVSFILTATNPNTSTDLTNVVVTDALPAALNYATHSATMGTASVSGTTLTWNIPSLPANSVAQLVLIVKLTIRGSVTNTITSPGATSASASMIVLPGGVVHYRMDEAAGSWNGTTGEVKDYGNQNLGGTLSRSTWWIPTNTNATVPGTTIGSSWPAVVRGDFCNAGKFDGLGVIKTPSSNFFQFSTMLSATAWIYPTQYPPNTGGNANDDIYAIVSNDTNYEFHLNRDGKLYWWWQLSPGTAYTLNSSATIPKNQWTHVAITFDSNSVNEQRIYINGVLDNTITTNPKGNLVKNTCPLYVGGDISTGTGCTLMPERSFVGMIDEAKIYDYQLLASEVAADMAIGRLCSGTFDHVRIEHDGTASTCTPKTLTVKACMDSGCTSYYPGPNVITVDLSPNNVWLPSKTVTIANGATTVKLDNTKVDASSATLTIGGTITSATVPNNPTVRCFNGSTETCVLNVATCNFDTVEQGKNPLTHLYTKLAGTPFSVDLLALRTTVLAGVTTTITNPSYTGTVAVDLVDPTSGNGCQTATALSNTAQTVVFSAANQGRKTITLTSSPVQKNVRVRMRDVLTSTYTCSTDLFAVRPRSLTLTTAKALATAPAPYGTPTLVAGTTTFDVAATTSQADGYVGVLTPDNNVLTAQLTTDTSARKSGGKVGTLTFDSSFVANTGARNGTYNEVGYLYINPGALSDKGFTAVDQNNQVAGCAASDTCDCLLSTNQTNAGIPDNVSDVLINGRYGCYVANKNTLDIGRFVPDHFGTSVTAPMACGAGLASCTGGMAYSGQPFTTTVTAHAGDGVTTTNYAAQFARAVTLTAWDGIGIVDAAHNLGAAPGVFRGNSAAGNNVIPSATFTAGAASVSSTYTFTATPTAPTNIFLRATESSGSDGVSSLRSTNPTTTSEETGPTVVNGRLKLSNAFGSEKSNLTIMAQIQFWNGNLWALSGTDVTTGPILQASGKAAVGLSNFKGSLSSPDNFDAGHVSKFTQGPGAAAGIWRLTLTPPAPTATGSVDVSVNLGSGAKDNCFAGPDTTGLNLPWLRSQKGSCTEAAAPYDPSARATFGIYRNPTVHTRELY